MLLAWRTPAFHCGSGNGKIIPTVNGGTKFDNSTTVLVMFPPPFNGTSNSHMAYEHGNEVFVPDLAGRRQSLAYWSHGWPRRLHHPRFYSATLGYRPAPRGHPRRHDPPPPRNRQPAHRASYPSLPQRHYHPEFLANATTVPDNLPRRRHLRRRRAPPIAHITRVPAPHLYASIRSIGGTPDPRGTICDPINKPELALVNQMFTSLVEICGMELGIGEVGESNLVAMGAVSGGW
ncbi:Isomerase YbhE [Mycena sanguinolenta]|uniref:Isomerase YbhE n=1 Tax=Mycena sanguinolenta TaxID=230812 RepID=A0A8H7DIZ7_9AGAR|nr:Isomerase YbhE [Mycena sanguinolenta]